MNAFRPFDTALLEPPTESELRQFSDRLINVAANLTLEDGGHLALDVDRRVTLADGSIQTIRFQAEYPLYKDVFSITTALAVPSIIDGVETENIELQEDSANEEHVLLKTSGKVVNRGGYQELSKKLTVYRGDGVIDATKSLVLYTYNDNLVELASQVYYREDTPSDPGDEIVMLERLYQTGEPFLDIESYEHDSITVTRADLILATLALKNCGIMRANTRAYKGAPFTVGTLRVLEACFDIDDDTDE